MTLPGRSIEREIASALKNSGFILAYQPKLDLKTGIIYGAEALLRMKDMSGLPMGIFDLIRVAESTGQIIEIGEFVMREACKASALWMMDGVNVHVSVNVSVIQLMRSGFVEMVHDAITQAGIAPGGVEIEITESVMINDPVRVIEVLRRLTDYGVKLSIDDFGAGYSSLTYLKRLPVHALKVDRSFVSNLENDPSDQIVAQSIISLGHQFGLEVIAEGVETDYQAEWLRAAGCDKAQGFFYGRPMSHEAFADHVRAHYDTLRAARKQISPHINGKGAWQPLEKSCS